MSIAQTTEDYFEEWHPYDLLIKHNHMRHREMIECLNRYSPHSQKRPLRVLDLGCGNAYVAQKALAHLKALNYTGIDLSGGALASARQNLGGLPWEIDLIEGEILSLLKLQDKTFDLVIAGFSLHHFSEETNLAILKEIKRLLETDGSFYLYDVITREDETHHEFNQRLLAGLEIELPEMPSTINRSIRDHIENNDFPVSTPVWQQLAKEAGFTNLKREYRDENEYYGCFLIQ